MAAVLFRQQRFLREACLRSNRIRVSRNAYDGVTRQIARQSEFGCGVLFPRVCAGFSSSTAAKPQPHSSAPAPAAATEPPASTSKGSTTKGTADKAAPGPSVQSQLRKHYKERFIPITRRSVVRRLIQEKNLLTETEQRQYETFAVALDSTIVNRFHGVLQQLKSLFDPINPDKDTIMTRKLTPRDRLDHEFWLLQKLSDVLLEANFHELPRHVVEQALKEHHSTEGVLVSVNPAKYDVLRFWALGKETPSLPAPLYHRMYNMALRRPAPEPLDLFKRIVVAVRLKKDDKLTLKAFKDVPVCALEQLLPDCTVKMSKLDRSLISSSLFLAAAGLLAKFVTVLAHYQVDWTLVVTVVTGMIGVRSWTVYKNRKNRYLAELNRTLYYRNVANNRGLLTLLVDRAEDEMFKEALLVYTFLLAHRPPSALTRDSTAGASLPAVVGSLSTSELESQISDWIHETTGSRLQFDCGEARGLLSELGLLSEDTDRRLSVLPLEAALANLPKNVTSLAMRVEEHDIIEGYDIDITDEPRNQEGGKISLDSVKERVMGLIRK